MPTTRPALEAAQQDKRTSPRFDAIIATPLPASRIGIRCNEQGISTVEFLPVQTPCQNPSLDNPYRNLIEQLLGSLQQYFSRPETLFSLPLAAVGTPFQHRVWQAISTITCGETRSYGQLAHELNTSPRAVGGACRANPLPLLVPCHRVISADGNNGGFLGQTETDGAAARLKQWLLHHEAGTIINHAQQH